MFALHESPVRTHVCFIKIRGSPVEWILKCLLLRDRSSNSSHFHFFFLSMSRSSRQNDDKSV